MTPFSLHRGRRISPEQLDIRARLFQVAQGRLGLRRVSVDREVQVEAVLERATLHGPAVETSQVDGAACEAVERLGQTAGTMGGYESERALMARGGFRRPCRLASLHNDEPRPVFRIILNRLREHVQAVAGRRRLAGDRRSAWLALFSDGARSTGRVVKGN